VCESIGVPTRLGYSQSGLSQETSTFAIAFRRSPTKDAVLGNQVQNLRASLDCPGDRAADFAELNMGFAYRPLAHDRFNVLGKYSYLRDLANDAQFADIGIELDDESHIWAVDFSYDITSRLNIVEKIAYKTAIHNNSISNEAIVNNLLWAHRFNYHVTKKWDVAIEYRLFWQSDAGENLRQGALVEVDREFYDYVRLGLGYNFTDFSDDLRKANSFDSHGPFMRLTGNF